MPEAHFHPPVEGTFDLNCTVVNCKENVTVFYVTYHHDRYGHPLPHQLQGPYMRFWDRTGGDEMFFEAGGLYLQDVVNGQIVIKEFDRVPVENEYAQGCPYLPYFGFLPGQVFWLCPAHKRNYHDSPLLKDIVAEAALGERIRNEAAEQAIRWLLE